MPLAGLDLWDEGGYAASRYYASRRRERIAKQQAARRSSATKQLEHWRDQGLLVIEDEALEAALYWEGADPKMLEKMIHLIQTILTEQELKPGGKDSLILTLKETADEEGIQDRHPPAPHGLEVVAAFG